MDWTSTTPTETMQWRHSAFPGMGKSSSLSALINYKYTVDFTTRSWWRVCSAGTINKESGWTFKFSNIQLICKNEPTWYGFLSYLESVLKCVTISMPFYISRKKYSLLIALYNILLSFLHWQIVYLLKICIEAPKRDSSSLAMWFELWRTKM